MICQAFIGASDDPTAGADQRSKTVKDKMHENYKALLKEQEKVDRAIFERSSSKTQHDNPMLVYKRTHP